MPKYIEIQSGLQDQAKKESSLNSFKLRICGLLSRRLDYASIGRKTFIVEQVPDKEVSLSSKEEIEGVIRENIIKEKEAI